MLASNWIGVYKQLSKEAAPLIVGIGLSYSLGFILTNMAFSKVTMCTVFT